MKSYKNRITFYFDEEHTQSFRIFVTTLEQVNVCLHYFTYCNNLEYLHYCFECCKNKVWTVERDITVDLRRDILEHRAKVAPFKLSIDTNKLTPAFDRKIELFGFSPFDTDILGMVLSAGSDNLPREALSYYCRDRETHEWNSRTPQALVDEDVANAYNSLSQESKSLAQKYFHMLD